jgi:hypothetical protein
LLQKTLTFLAGLERNFFTVSSVPCVCSWSSLKPLCIPRCFAGLTEVANHLYLVGGQTSDQCMSIDTVEQYLEECDEWEIVAEMRVPRSDAACCCDKGTKLDCCQLRIMCT